MRAIFLDRDGVICYNRTEPIKTWEEFHFLPGVKNNLVALSRLDLPIIIVTNQAIIGQGIVTAKIVEDIHQRLIAELTAYGGRIDRILYCPHQPEDKCHCRKPEAGMLLQAAEEMDIDLSHSYLVGDSITDLIAGQRVGCRTFLVLTGHGLQQLLPSLHWSEGHFTVVQNLTGATVHIIKSELGISQLKPPQFDQLWPIPFITAESSF